MAAKRKPCKRGKVRRRVKGGRVMCVVKKKKAAPQRKSARKSRAQRAWLPARGSSGNRTWYFDWTSGGFNTVQAKTAAEALEKARAKGEAYSSPGHQYRVVASSLKPATRQLDMRYYSMSD